MIELRDFTPADGQLLTTWISGPAELLMWSGRNFTWPLDADQLAAYAAESASGRRTWMVQDAATGELIGHASLRVNPTQPTTARLGRVLVAPSARGRGYAVAMLEQVLTTAFTDLDLQLIELGVFAHNTTAIRLYERLGFTCDHVIPDVEQVDGYSWSANQMTLTKSTWSTRAAHGDSQGA